VKLRSAKWLTGLDGSFMGAQAFVVPDAYGDADMDGFLVMVRVVQYRRRGWRKDQWWAEVDGFDAGGRTPRSAIRNAIKKMRGCAEGMPGLFR
tara:strand:- start:444 stop:722 length:279 start_codon:yes stop_codon:yes gene_type:complete